MERHQVALYLGALAIGATTGLLAPAVAHPAQLATTPVLGILLYATFLAVPFAAIGQALRDGRFIAAVLGLNFVAAPIVVFGLTRVIAHNQVLLVGVLFVLLTPCVDYVITFTGLAGGAKARLVAAAPLLMLTQMLLLPFYLWLMAGPDFASTIDVEPFAQAFVFLIVVPMVAAAITQFAAARSRSGARLHRGVLGAMVPLLMLTLAVVVASHIAAVGQRIGRVLWVIPIFVGFAAIMAGLGVLAARLARVDAAGGRAILFSGVTRNSLVVLPLVLALPAAFDLAPLVVVTQTLVELIIMVILVRAAPRLIPRRTGPAAIQP